VSNLFTSKHNRAVQVLVAVLFVCVLVVCSKKEATKEAVTIEEILGEKSVVDSIETNVSEKPALDGTFVSELNQQLYQKYHCQPHKQTTLIDRFTYESVEKTEFTSLEDSTASTVFFMYNFADSSATINAFNNLMACFGSACQEIIINEPKQRVEESPMWCGVYEKSIVILKYSDNALSFKNDLKQTIFKTKGEKLKYTLNVTPNSELKWD
jgi:hypothetical protein